MYAFIGYSVRVLSPNNFIAPRVVAVVLSIRTEDDPVASCLIGFLIIPTLEKLFDVM